jgi:hypothetical protein
MRQNQEHRTVQGKGRTGQDRTGSLLLVQYTTETRERQQQGEKIKIVVQKIRNLAEGTPITSTL